MVSDAVMAIWGLPMALVVISMFLFTTIKSKLSGTAFLVEGVALLAFNLGYLGMEPMCIFSLLAILSVLAEFMFGNQKLERAIRRNNEYDRLQAIERAWWDRHPDAMDQLRTWLEKEHGLDHLDIQYPSVSSDGDGNMTNTWYSRKTGQTITLPWIFESMDGSWRTRSNRDWLSDLREWEAYKKKHAGDLDALEKYVTSHHRGRR